MSQDKNTYKDTLNLPKTSFDMKANLLAKEPQIQQRWQQENLYGQIMKSRKGSPRFVLHDGPPYANGNIHMGHALNKVLKDLVVRLKTMSGMDATPQIHGWDCHGQPIEQKVVDELGAKAGTLGAMEIRRRCQDFARKWIDIQRDQFRRLGLTGIDDEPYITMDKAYEASVLELFARLVDQGLVYKQLKPVHWSIENRTALADAELEYHDRQDSSIYVAFRLTDDSLLKLAQFGPAPGNVLAGHVGLLVWTTTPWTLPANLAVAVHPGFVYSLVRAQTADGQVTFVIAQGRLEGVLGALDKKRAGYVKSHKEVGTFAGRQLIEAGLLYHHPLKAGKTCPVVGAEYVTLEDGTGLVHTAPGHGLEDYGTGLKNGLEIYCPVQADGTFDDTAPDLVRGMSVWKANPVIVEHLRKADTLLLDETVTHSYPHDWRSKTPTIFRATEQWFIAVDRGLRGTGKSLRSMALDACRNEDLRHGGIRFVPEWGRNRLVGMLQSRPDWCISRQRSWGLPIPAFYNKAGTPLLTPSSVRAVARTISEEGSNAWFELSPGELLAGYDPHKDKALENPGDFPVDELTAGRDIFDVWFESGSSWFAAAMRRGLVTKPPVDLYLEGSDQHRGWFQLSLLPALGAMGVPPFSAIVTHGFIVDEDARKFSKSAGNTIDVADQLAKRGADILRLWVASTNYQDDVRCSDALIAQTEDSYRKIRNTLRFCMGACFDFNPAVNATEPADHSIDRWMRLQLHELIRDVRAAYGDYEFHKAARLIYEFCTVQASSIYLSAAKDRLYCESPDAMRRRATQTVIHEMLLALVKLLAPILPHTCEEAWEHIPFRPTGEPHSVHLAMLPDYDAEMLHQADDLAPVNLDLAQFTVDMLQGGASWIWTKLLDLRGAGLVKLEALRNAGVKNSLDSEAAFTVASGNDAVAQLIQTYIRELEDMLGVGYSRLERGPLPEGVVVDVEVFDTREKYQRCARSWKRRPDVGSDAQYPDISARDAAVMKELKAKESS